IQGETMSAFILITHALGEVANEDDRDAVMYGGKIVETGTEDEIFYEPKHPYTGAVLGSMPMLNDTRKDVPSIPGTPRDLKDPPKGCPFAARCPYAMKVCDTHMHEYQKSSDSQKTACWLLDERAPKVDPPENIFVGGAKE